MLSTKSFCNVSAFLSNVPGIVNPIGELSTYGYTFSREIGYFHHTTIPGYDLLNLSSQDEGVMKTMPQVNIDQAVALVDHVVKATLGTTGELYYDEILLQLKTKAETINAISIEIGAMVSANGRWVPQWISWVDNNDPEDNVHKVWLALEAFKDQYTDYEIIVVPPFDDLDAFFNPGSIVENRVKAITPSQMMERADIAKEGHPDTLTRTDPYEYRDPVNISRRFDVYWTVVLYGPGGNDPDVIREALVTYILANSTHTRDEWAVIFPDIFKRTEFIFAPFFDQYAAEQRAFNHGVYSPILNHAKPVTFLTTYAKGYSVDHIKDKAQVMGFPYRSLQIAIIGHIENRDGKVSITDYYPDFINAGTIDGTDFGRMSPNTQTWVKIMMDLIVHAENLTAAIDLPRGTYRVIRDGVTYLARNHERVLLLVVAKSNISNVDVLS